MAVPTHPFRPLPKSSKRCCPFDILTIMFTLSISIFPLSISIHFFSSSTIRKRQLHRACRSLRRRTTTRTTRFMPQNRPPNIRRRIRKRRRTLTRRSPILTREISLRSTPFPTTSPTTTNTASRRPRSKPGTLRRHAHTRNITAQGTRAMMMPVTLIHHGL